MDTVFYYRIDRHYDWISIFDVLIGEFALESFLTCATVDFYLLTTHNLMTSLLRSDAARKDKKT